MSETRTRSTFTQARQESERTAVTIAKERLPWHDAIGERFGIKRAEWRALVEGVWPAARTVEGVLLALSYCQGRKLDPFKRPVHIVPVWNSDLGRMVETVWPGIGELRTTAFRTGQYVGCDETRFGPDVTEKFANGNHPPVEVTYPEWAQMTIHRMLGDIKFSVPGPRVYWKETYATKGRGSDAPNEMWTRRPRGQLDKCFGRETEVLTDQGFQRFDTVTGRILQVTASGLEPVDVKPFRQDWTGSMVTADGDALNFRVTPNHDMYTTIGKVEAETLFERATSTPKFRIPISVSGTKPEASVSDDAIRLAAAFCCDGWRRPYGTFSIGVSRGYKVTALENLGRHSSCYIRRADSDKTTGDEISDEIRTITTRKDKIVFSYGEEALEDLIGLDKFFDRDRLLSLSRRQSALLVDAMIFHDGSDNGRGTLRYFSSSPQLLAAFEIAAIQAGYSVSPRRERVGDLGGPNWCITVSDKETLPAVKYGPSQIAKGLKGGLVREITNPDGEVWCCRVPSGLIVVRRDGLSMICGNCSEAGALRRAFPEEVGNDYIPEEVGGSDAMTIEGEKPVETFEPQPAPEPTPEPQVETRPTTQRQASATQRRNKKAQEPPELQPEPEPPIVANDPVPVVDAEPIAAPDEGFTAWLVDEAGEATRNEPYLDPVSWAKALTAICQQRPPLADDILQLNDAAMREAWEASDEARNIIRQLLEPPAEPEPPPEPEPETTVLDVPMGSNNKPDWGAYREAAFAAIDKLTTVEAVTEWMAANETTWRQRYPSLQTQQAIERRAKDVLGKLIPAAPEVDRETKIMEAIKQGVANSNVPDGLQSFWMSMIVARTLAEFSVRKDEIVALFNERHRALTGNAGPYK